MNEGEFLNQSISYLRKEMDAEALTQFEAGLDTLEPDRKELFTRLKESQSVMGDLVPMATTLEAGDFSPWEAQWLEFAKKHGLEDKPVAGSQVVTFERERNQWRISAIAALLVACLSVGILTTRKGNLGFTGNFDSLPTSAQLSSWSPGEGGSQGTEAGQTLGTRAGLVTGTGGRAVLLFQGGVSTLVSEDSQFSLDASGKEGMVTLGHGELLVKGADNFKIPVRAGLGDVILKGNGILRIVSAKGKAGLWVGVASGQVEFVHAGGNVQIGEGQRLEARGADGVLVMHSQELSGAELDKIQRMAQRK